MLVMKNITKIFGQLKANDNVSVTFESGKVHALLGENGAGKSTLMSILFGLYKPDFGDIELNGETIHINNPNDAAKYGIGMVHQHFKLVETFSVIDNIILGVEETKKGFIVREKARQKINELANKYHLNVDVDAIVKDLTVGQQQKVEILKMLYRDSNILIFDEPTAVLTPQEIDELMGVMRNFALEGKIVILITHKLNEIKAVADQCTVLRKGIKIDTVEVANLSIKEMSEMMVGRPVLFKVEKGPYRPRNIALSLKQINLYHVKKHLLKDISFDLFEGEILGVVGIDGNGQKELIHVISGLQSPKSGHIILNGEDITKTTIKKRYQKGLSHIPEDRQKHGLILDFNLAYNFILQEFKEPKYQTKGFLRKQNIFDNARKLIEKYDIRSSNDAHSIVRSMSGGNQQKAILAREIDRNHHVILAVQPTRGLDVGAIEFIHKQLIQERDLGRAVLLVSLELDEILSIADRIIVIFDGEITGQFITKDVSAEELGLYMSGSKKDMHNESEVS